MLLQIRIGSKLFITDITISLKFWEYTKLQLTFGQLILKFELLGLLDLDYWVVAMSRFPVVFIRVAVINRRNYLFDCLVILLVLVLVVMLIVNFVTLLSSTTTTNTSTTVGVRVVR